MSSLERLGANIRSLRKAYGETQEELGAALDVEKIQFHITKMVNVSQIKICLLKLPNISWCQLRN